MVGVVLKNTEYDIVHQTLWIVVAVAIGVHLYAVVSVETVACTNPDVVAAVFIECLHATVYKTLLGCEQCHVLCHGITKREK